VKKRPRKKQAKHLPPAELAEALRMAPEERRSRRNVVRRDSFAASLGRGWLDNLVKA